MLWDNGEIHRQLASIVYALCGKYALLCVEWLHTVALLVHVLVLTN